VRILMLGWEFPPFISGGLGTACQGLTRAMGDLGMEIVFVLPMLVTRHPVSGTANATESLRSPLLVPLDPVSGGRLAMQSRQIEFRKIPSPIVSPYASCGQTPPGSTSRDRKVAGISRVPATLRSRLVDPFLEPGLAPDSKAL